jgi:hypothetical protein
MKRILFLATLSICLSGDISTEGQFFARIAGEFSMVVSTRSLSNDLGAGNTASTMGSFTVTITDTIDTGTATNKVMLYSTITDPADNAVIQIVRQVPLVDPSPDHMPTRIDMTITDDLQIDGTAGNTLIANNQSIRDRTVGTDPTFSNEVHTLTLEAGARNGTLTGNYRTTIYFQLEGP